MPCFRMATLVPDSSCKESDYNYEEDASDYRPHLLLSLPMAAMRFPPILLFD